MDNINSKPNIDKHIIDQTNIEIGHVRSWPITAMMFYIAFNVGIVSFVIALQSPFLWWMKAFTTTMVLASAICMICTLWYSNKNYITHRELQIDLQTRLFRHKRKEYNLPSFWFEKKERCSCIKYPGWLFYVMFVILVAISVLFGIFVIKGD